MREARRRKHQWDTGDWSWEMGVSRDFHVGPGLKEVVRVFQAGGIVGFKDREKLPADKGGEALAARAGWSLGPERPAEDEANVMEVRLQVIERQRVALVHPGRIDVVGPVGHDFRSHHIAEGEILDRAVVLGELLIGGAADGADVSHHMVAVITAAARPNHIFGRAQQAHDAGPASQAELGTRVGTGWGVSVLANGPW